MSPILDFGLGLLCSVALGVGRIYWHARHYHCPTCGRNDCALDCTL